MLEESILAKEGSTYQEMAVCAASAPARMPRHCHTSVALRWPQTFVSPRLSNSLRFWPRLGLHAFRKISPTAFHLRSLAGMVLPFCTPSSLSGHKEMGESLGKEKKKNSTQSKPWEIYQGLHLFKNYTQTFLVEVKSCLSQRTGDSK